MADQTERLRIRFAILTVTGLALFWYAATSAPGLTWEHFGADGGELLAAAAGNGVPHPPGYPLYILLLQAWLAMGQAIDGAPPARWGALLSVVCGALSAGVTVATAAALLAPRRAAWLWASISGLAWAAAPLVWSQSLITEVYALHALLVAVIGWAALTNRRAVLPLALGLGLAHHITSLLLWPALFYWLWTQPDAAWGRTLRPFAGALLIGGLLYLRIPWAAASGPPINWGYADNVHGLWWLVSGEAYRDYLFGVAWADLPGRVARWARILAGQFTPIGLAIVLVGMAHWDQTQPRLHRFGLLWIAWVTLYSLTYRTTDSHVYLLPVVWMAALWFANGLAVGVDWLYRRGAAWAMPGVAVAVSVGLLVTAALRVPEVSLRHDRAAEDFLVAAADTFEPGSVVISSTDAQTFALWYGAWAGDPRVDLSDRVLVNHSLYQFDWYRRLLGGLYPDIPGIDQSLEALLEANTGMRPIFLAEPIPELPGVHEPIGPFWRLEP